MAISPSELHSVDVDGYTFVTYAAQCQVATYGLNISISTSGTPPIPIPQGVSGTTQPLRDRLRIHVINVEPFEAVDPNKTLYLGSAGVTPANGYPLKPRESVMFEMTHDLQLFATKSPSAFGSIQIRVLEEG